MASESTGEVKEEKTTSEKSEKEDAPVATKTKSEEPAPAKTIEIEQTSSGLAAAAVAVAPPATGMMGKKMDERIFNLNKQIIDRVYDLICFFYPVKVSCDISLAISFAWNNRITQIACYLLRAIHV